MSNAVTYEDFHKICRFCMDVKYNEKELLPLFVDPNSYGRFSKVCKESIPEIVSSCIGLSLDMNDGLPLHMCASCCDRLMAHNSFRHLCLQSANILQEIKIQKHYEGLEYDSEDNEPLHSLKPPEMVFIETIKNECDINDSELGDLDSSQADDNHDYGYCHDDYEEEEIKPKQKFSPRPKQPKRQTTTTKTSAKRKSTTETIPVVPPKKSATITKPSQSKSSASATITTATASSTAATFLSVKPAFDKKDPSILNDDVSSSYNQNTSASESDQKANVQQTPKPPKNRNKLPKQCTVCGLIVKRLRDHMKIHPEALEFKCQHCHRTYLTQTGLDRHMDTQHTERSDQMSNANTNMDQKQTASDPTSTDQTGKYSKPHLWKANVRKRLREMGLDYIDTRGNQRPAREIREPCREECVYECTLNFNYDERLRLHKDFWHLKRKEKLQFYVDYVERAPVKRAKQNSRRSCSFIYHFNLGNRRLQVCKKFFLNTLDISDTPIYHYFNHNHGRPERPRIRRKKKPQIVNE